MTSISLPAFICLLILPLACPAQNVADSVRSRVACTNSERLPISVLVDQRNSGTSAQALIERSSALPENDGSRLINLGRIEDVYLDKSLTLNTLVAFRSAKCLEDALLQNFTPFREFTRTELLKCQELGYPGDRKFGNCVYGLVYALKDKVNKH